MGWEVGGRFSKEGTHVYLWLTHVHAWQKAAQFCKAIILQLKNKQIKKRSLILTTFQILTRLLSLKDTKWDINLSCNGYRAHKHVLTQGWFARSALYTERMVISVCERLFLKSDNLPHFTWVVYLVSFTCSFSQGIPKPLRLRLY